MSLNISGPLLSSFKNWGFYRDTGLGPLQLSAKPIIDVTQSGEDGDRNMSVHSTAYCYR